MRISDWSSDVCSSDLRLAIGAGQVWRDCLADCRYPAAARSVHTAVEGARRSRSRDRRNPPLSWGSLERIGCLIDRTVQSLKIGIASCRERVWQYVSIKVVAATIKKTKNTPSK